VQERETDGEKMSTKSGRRWLHHANGGSFRTNPCPCHLPVSTATQMHPCFPSPAPWTMGSSVHTGGQPAPLRSREPHLSSDIKSGGRTDMRNR
jgi:hypothetical protein